MTRTRLLTPVFLLLVVGLLGAGCDSGSSGGGGIIAPNDGEVTFNVKPDSTESKSVTVSYSGLSDRPTIDTTGIPDSYSIEVAEENGSPGNGSTTFNVTFNGPAEPGSYPTPVRLRAGGATATMRLVGSVIRVFTVADYGPDAQEIVAFGGPSAQVQNGELVIQGEGLGGELVFPGVATIFDETTDFSGTPVLAARIKVASSSDGPAILRAALNGAEGNADANVTVDPLVKEVPADGSYATYYFDFRGNFRQFDGAEVDPSRMAEVVFLVNDNNPDTFSGTIYIDEVNRRQNIPK
jgi:hypothetical protein